MSLRDRLSSLLAGFTRNHSRLGLRATVAAICAYGLALAFHLPNGYWAVLSAVLVVQSSLGASLAVATDRALGTVAGGVIGVVCAILAGPSLPLTVLLLAAGVFIGSTLAARSSSFKLAPVTVCIVMLSDPIHADALVSGLHRVMEIVLGGMVALACSLVVLPARALAYLFPYGAAVLEASARLAELGAGGLLGRGLDPATVDTLNAKTRAALRAADARVTEARAERAGRLASHPDPAPIVRTCRRLWHSVIILLRSADTPLPTPLAERIGPALDAAVAALATHMRAVAAEMRGGATAGTAPAMVAAVAALESEAEQLNATGALDAATGPTLTALFAAVSACGQMRENLEDLAARLGEMEKGEA